MLDFEYKKLTYKQLRVWNEWFDMQWNNPGRLEKYIMQLTAYVHMLGVDPKKKKKFHLKDYEIEFKEEKKAKPLPSNLDKEYISDLSLMTWAMRLGGPGKIRGFDKAIEHSKKVARQRREQEGNGS